MWGSFLFVWNIQKQRKIGNITQKSEAKLPKLFFEHYLTWAVGRRNLSL